MEEPSMHEIYRLTKENNRMLHAMRRDAFWGGVIKLIIYAALIVVPFWLYMQYFAPVVDQALETMQQMQGTSAQAQAQFGSFQQALQDLQSKIPFIGQTGQ